MAPVGARPLPPRWVAGLGNRRGLDDLLDASVEAGGC